MRRKLALALVLSIAVSATWMPASAETPSPSPKEGQAPVALTEEEALRKDAQGYAEALGLSVDEAIRRSHAMDRIGEPAETLAASAPDRFAGGWFEHTPQFRAVILFKGAEALPAAAVTSIASDADVAVVLGASASLEELLAGQERVSTEAATQFPSMGLGLDIERNELVLTGPDAIPSSALEALQDAAGVPIRTAYSAGDMLANTWGGRLMEALRGGYYHLCTSGFTVRDRVSGRMGILTAGHCNEGWPYGVDYHEDAGIWPDMGTTECRWPRRDPVGQEPRLRLVLQR